VERSKDPSLPDRAVTGVRAPTITVYAPEKPNGIALLVTPGGSYQRVVLDKEGSDLAPVFNARGYTLFVMTYRMPADGHAEGSEAPLADAQRALRTCGRGPPSGISTRKNRHYGLFRRGTRGGKPGDPL
jgi:acetyl esterase/lipase